jgi:hypothetical protein
LLCKYNKASRAYETLNPGLTSYPAWLKLRPLVIRCLSKVWSHKRSTLKCKLSRVWRHSWLTLKVVTGNDKPQNRFREVWKESILCQHIRTNVDGYWKNSGQKFRQKNRLKLSCHFISQCLSWLWSQSYKTFMLIDLCQIYY